ncbi:hypothetical protein BCR32DRAFT_283941 [Anaeromyces robustus]|jgi:hypothetical protein|uniref:RTA1-domain-containing protein n=1 Tax=Anaeromyces robustus TaxID=1754192 RepID=A0A1Y1WTM4_9FUNG|nr:hypothetical protein BCR32DRAFT_283941 [Anaeromyces robustus]|eukprot:ORX76648.1 hypothetical protein BCR32DRAFT_283941 [Anaeromyces robustus]
MSETIKLDRFHPDTSTCDGKNIQHFYEGFFGQFQDSFCYTFVIQFIIVALMYYNVGKGRYWKVLFYASLAGLCGAVVENMTVAVICTESNKTKEYGYIVPFLINEIFWAPCEYAIPYLNLIKMKAFAKGKLALWMRYIIIGLTVPFALFRFLIGWNRMTRGYLQDSTIHSLHGYAFAVMALADILCTFCILYFVRKNNSKMAIKTSNINDYIKHSSYTILLCVDIVSTLLSILNIITNTESTKDLISGKLVTPLHCLKCSFVLILAADALIFKYGVNTSSIHSSDNSRTYTYGAGADSYNFATKSTNGYVSRNNYSNNYSTTVDMSNVTNNNTSNTSLGPSSGKNQVSQLNMYSVSPYNYPTIDSDIIKSPVKKSIIKNYTNIKTPPSAYESPDSAKTYTEYNVYPQQQQFGFLNQNKEYMKEY